MEKDYFIAENKLKEYNQEHLLNFYDELDKIEKAKLIEDIINVDFEQMQSLYKNINNSSNNTNESIESIEYINKEKLSESERDYYNKIGITAIKNGEYAVVTMAGGQRYKTRTYWS